MPTVYVVNKSGHDFSSAEKFGDLKYLSVGTINPYQVLKIYRQFAEGLKDSTPDDYLLITGLPIMTAVATAIMSRKHGVVNFLIYHAGTNTYKNRRIIIDTLLTDDSPEEDANA